MKKSKFLAFFLWSWGCSGGLYEALLEKAAPNYELRVFVYSPNFDPLAHYHIEVKQLSGGFHTYAVDPEGLVIFVTEAGESKIRVLSPTMDLYETGSVKISPTSTNYTEDLPKVHFLHGSQIRFEIGKITPVIPKEGSFAPDFYLPPLTIRASGQKTEYPVLLTMKGGKSPYRFSLVSETTSVHGIFPYMDRLRNLLFLNGSFALLPDNFSSSDGNFYLGSINLLAEDAGGGWTHLNLALYARFKYVFVSNVITEGDMGGITYPACQGLSSLAKADCACQEEAKLAGLKNPEKFVAYLSTTTHSARCRLAGLGPGCSSFPAQGGPWYHAPRMEIYERKLVFSDLTLGTPPNPIRYSVLGEDKSALNIWTGSNSSGDPVTNNCMEWTSADPSVSGHYGVAGSTANWASDTTSMGCNVAIGLYCFERD